MPIIRTFVSHHGGDLPARVEPLLRRVAPLGIRPWLDKRDLSDRVGLPLDQQLQEALFKGPCSSLSLFLTKAAVTRRWIEQEVQWALERVPDGFRILPILLDPLESIELPSTFREFLERRKVLWLEPDKDPRFLEKYAASMHAAGGLDSTTRELTLYLGHRSPHWVGELPAEWAATPALDLRLDLLGDLDFSPTEAEWQELESALCTLRSRLGQLERINLCGQAPLGVGTMIGKVWDRGYGPNGPVQLRSYNALQKQVWTTEAADYDQTGDWTPEHAQHVKMERPATLRHRSILLVLLTEGKEEYLRHVHRWNEQREAPLPVHIARVPSIHDPEHAQQVLRECVGLLRFFRRTCPSVDVIEVISVHALALAPLLAHYLRTLGPLHFYDEVKSSHQYRLATTIS